MPFSGRIEEQVVVRTNLKTLIVESDELAKMDAVETAARIRGARVVGGRSRRRCYRNAPKLSTLCSTRYRPVTTLARWSAAKNPLAGPFAGVPTFIKDLDDVAGVVNSYGSRAHLDNVPKRTDRFIAKILDTGSYVWARVLRRSSG
jgi:amidase